MRQILVRLVRLLKLGAIVGLVVGAVRAVTRDRTPPVMGKSSWPALVEPPVAAKRSGPVKFDEPAATEWLEPIDGECPPTHLIKGNAGSGIYHIPGGTSYARTVPERCYATEDAAQADGFRKAKR